MSNIVTRKMTHSLSFDGVNDFVEVADADLPASAFQGGFTLEAWIMPKSGGENTEGRLFDKSTSTGGADGMRLCMRYGQKALGMTVNAGAQADSTYNELDWNKWNHFVVTVSADAKVNFYINGVLSGDADQTTGALSGITTTNALRIGNRSGATDRSFDGNIMRPRIIFDTYDATDAKNAYLYGTVKKGATYREWMNDIDHDGAGTTVYESTGNANAAISGATWSTKVPLRERVAVPTKMPHVLRYDGVDDSVRKAGGIAGLGSGYSFTTDIYIPSNDYATPQGIFGNSTSTSDRSAVHIYSNNIRAGYYNGASFAGSTSVSKSKIPQSKPYRLTYTFDGTSGVIYIDGSAVHDGTTAPSTDDDNYLAFGCKTNALELLKGQMWNSVLHSRALTPTEVYDLHFHNIIPTKGLVGNWNRISDDGQYLLNSVGGNHGTINGATRVTDLTGIPTPRKAVVPHVGSVEFDGSNDEVDTNEQTISGLTNGFTVGGYVMLTKSGSMQRFAGNRSGGTGFGFGVHSSNELMFTTFDVQDYFSSFILPLRKWAHVVAVFDTSNDVTFFVDGVPVGKDTHPLGANVGTGTMKLGQSGINLQYFGGRISQFRCYKTTLTSEEVEQWALTNITPYDNDKNICVLNLEAKTGMLSGSSWRDQSANGNHGTFSGATLSAEAPTKQRKKVDGNLVFNGDFALRPYLSGVHTENKNKWIDGTVSGSNANDIFGWHALETSDSSGTSTWQFQQQNGEWGMRVTIDEDIRRGGGSTTQLGVANTVYTSATLTMDQLRHACRVQPNTTYRVSFDYIVFSRDDEVNLRSYLQAYDNTGSRQSGNSENVADETLGTLLHQEMEVTTAADEVYLCVSARGLPNQDCEDKSIDFWVSKFRLEEVT